MCILTIMLNIDATAVNLAIPVISHELNSTLANMQWVINAYVLVTAMVTIIGGRFGDLWGHRRIFVWGTIIFVVSSTVAGFAHSDQLLIAARAAQGFRLGIAYPMTLAIIYDVFPKNQYGLAIGVVIGVMGASLAIGPTIGGLIVSFVGG